MRSGDETRYRRSGMSVSSESGGILVRGFPSWLGGQEKKSLLTHFGASEVTPMANRGRMRNCAFAVFSNPDGARRAMGKLHQLEIFGHRLVVELARPHHSKLVQESKEDRWECNTSRLEENAERSKVKEPDKKDSQPPLPPAKSSPPPPPPHNLSYNYPPPTPTTLHNITNALVCVPKLYVQVLHLMNKMNLPPPFGPPTPTPPLPPEHLPPSPEGKEEEEEGSEIESDEDVKHKLTARLTGPRREAKRRALSFRQVKGPPSLRKRKRPEGEEEWPSAPVQPKKIAIHIPSEISQPPLQQGYVSTILPSPHPEQTDIMFTTITTTQTVPGGKLTRVEQNSTVVSPYGQLESGVEYGGRLLESGVEYGSVEEEPEEMEEFISLAELEANRLPDSDLRESGVFKNYSPGEPSLRLYVKNLTKHVTEKELRYIFGRYVDWTSEQETNMFDIRVMQTGRMKGQAFVGLPSEEAATTAVQETNRYLLQGKPMVVQFARSTRPREKD